MKWPLVEPKAVKRKQALEIRGGKASSKRHYMYVSPEEAHFFRELIVKFIVASGPDNWRERSALRHDVSRVLRCRRRANCRRLPEGQAGQRKTDDLAPP